MMKNYGKTLGCLQIGEVALVFCSQAFLTSEKICTFLLSVGRRHYFALGRYSKVAKF
jgi:hypothetical protein